MFFRHTRWAWLWALVIAILCGMPGRDIPHFSFLEMLSFDKWVHAGIFFILQLLLSRGFGFQQQFMFLHRYPKSSAFVLSVFYGGVLELLQDAVFEERSADVYDFIANSFGALMGLLLYTTFAKRINWLNYERRTET